LYKLFTLFILFSLSFITINCDNNDKQSTSIVFATKEYSTGENRLMFSSIGNKGSETKKDFRVEVLNKTDSHSYEYNPTFYFWPNKNSGFYTFNHQFSNHGKYELRVYDSTNPKEIYLETINISEKNQSPIVGEMIPVLNNKILSNPLTINEISSDPDPDPDFYMYRLSDALKLNKPIIVFFISPSYCKTATCLPQLDVIKNLKNYYDDKIIFIHVEVYDNPHLIRGDIDKAQISPILDEWNIYSEPFIFIIKDKILVSKFQGYVSYEEIIKSVKQLVYDQ
tara:strand:- start:412 stop:1254 length:843 start_codon:yes stop_codon:yes gene_type:complete